MEEGDELARWLKRLENRNEEITHSVRRLLAVMERADKVGILDTLRQWIFSELYRIEGQANDVNEAIDRLADKVRLHL